MSSEDLPLPTPIQVSGNSQPKESILLKYYRTISSSTGTQVTVNSTITPLLPNGIYNSTQSSLGMSTFPNNNSVTINKSGSFAHTIVIEGYSTYPQTGIIVVDLVNAFGVQYGTSVFTSKNVTSSTTSPLILEALIQNASGNNYRLRFGGGSATTGGNLEYNILSIDWKILEK